jgi:AhpD family alkylhydroperoxidase
MRREAIFAEGAVPARFKTLAAMLWAIAARCEPCAEFYVGEAVRLGATEEEIGEVLAVASAMGGCVGEMWALKAYKAYKQAAGKAGEGCCPA